MQVSVIRICSSAGSESNINAMNFSSVELNSMTALIRTKADKEHWKHMNSRCPVCPKAPIELNNCCNFKKLWKLVLLCTLFPNCHCQRTSGIHFISVTLSIKGGCAEESWPLYTKCFLKWLRNSSLFTSKHKISIYLIIALYNQNFLICPFKCIWWENAAQHSVSVLNNQSQIFHQSSKGII